MTDPIFSFKIYPISLHSIIYETELYNTMIYINNTMRLFLSAGIFLNRNVNNITEVRPNQVWQHHGPREYNQILRAVLSLPYLVGLYLSRAYSKVNTSHSKSNSEESILIPVWSSYLNFTLIFIDFPGTSNPEPISHIKIAYNYNTSTSAYHFIDTFFPIITCCELWLGYFKFIFLFICNPSISNLGPDSPYKHKFSSTLSVFYQNIQGLISFGNLAENHPVLDNNKLFELHTYIYNHSPDIIILNETWLKPSILDSEILPPNK